MKTYIILEITHRKPIDDLSTLIAQRAYVLDGVTDTHSVVVDGTGHQILAAGFDRLKEDYR